MNSGAGEDAWESLDSKEIKPVNPKENQCWIFIGKTDDEAETPMFWLPDEKSRLIGKDPDAGKDWGEEEKGQQSVRWLDGITDLMDMGLSNLQETVKGRKPGALQFMELQRVAHDSTTEQQMGGLNIAFLISYQVTLTDGLMTTLWEMLF